MCCRVWTRMRSEDNGKYLQSYGHRTLSGAATQHYTLLGAILPHSSSVTSASGTSSIPRFNTFVALNITRSTRRRGRLDIPSFISTNRTPRETADVDAKRPSSQILHNSRVRRLGVEVGIKEEWVRRCPPRILGED